MRVSSSSEHEMKRKAEMKSYYEEEKELLIRVVKEVRCDPERLPPNVRYIDTMLEQLPRRSTTFYPS